ncbi:MAG: hypothetical protein Q9195_007985 [Heterodermia aff. obscurata]
MLPARRLQLKTASAANSIWRESNEDDFRTRVVALEKASGEIPSDPKVHSAERWSEISFQHNNRQRLLPFLVEQRLADDFAFVAAAKEHPKAVSAATVQERSDGLGLIICLAANDGVLPEVEDTFKAMLDLLARCAARDFARASCELALFQCVLKLCEERIHGRLESDHWTRPRHQPGRPKQPLHLALRKLVSSLKPVRSNAPRSIQDLRKELDDLANIYQAVDHCSNDPDQRMEAVKTAVRESHSVCTSSGTCLLESTILAHGLDPKFVCEDRVIRQVNKIGRYWGLCHDMANDSRRYRSLFENPQLECLPPFTGTKSRIYAKPTRKGFVECHVHAEIQMLIHCDQKQKLLANTLQPRVIGVNKAACYLCNLFFQHGRQYFITKTHGHLYNQWTLPDLAAFTPQQRTEYRRIIAAMCAEMENAVKIQPERRRAAPTGSWISLPTPPPQTSPLGSDAGTLVLGDSQDTPPPPPPLTPNSMTPRASPRPLSAQGSEATTPRASPLPLARSSSSSDCDPSSLAPPLTRSPQIPPPPPPINPAIKATSPRSPSPSAAELPPASNDLSLLQLHPQTSSTTISLHPLSHPLTAPHPLHIPTLNLTLTLEIAGPGTGEVKASIVNIDATTTVDAIDIAAMKPGEEILLSKDVNASTMDLLLVSGGRNGAVRLELRWMG